MAAGGAREDWDRPAGLQELLRPLCGAGHEGGHRQEQGPRGRAREHRLGLRPPPAARAPGLQVSRTLLRAPGKPHASHSGRITATFVRARGSSYLLPQEGHPPAHPKGPQRPPAGLPARRQQKSSRENLSRQGHLPQCPGPGLLFSHSTGCETQFPLRKWRPLNQGLPDSSAWGQDGVLSSPNPQRAGEARGLGRRARGAGAGAMRAEGRWLGRPQGSEEPRSEPHLPARPGEAQPPLFMEDCPDHPHPVGGPQPDHLTTVSPAQPPKTRSEACIRPS